MGGFLSKVSKQLKRSIKDVEKVVKKTPQFKILKLQGDIAKGALDPIGLGLRAIDPKLAQMRTKIGTTAATAVVGNIVLGAAGTALGLTDLASPSAIAGGAGGLAPTPGGNNMGLLDTIQSVLDTANNIANTGRGVIDQFQGRQDSPAVQQSSAPLQGTTIPTWAMVGGAVGLLVVVVLIVKK